MASLEQMHMIEQMADAFSSQTYAQIDKVKKEKCSKCRWRGVLGSDGKKSTWNIFCNWSLLNDKPFRDCLPSECKYFEKGKFKKEPTKHICVSGRRRTKK